MRYSRYPVRFCFQLSLFSFFHYLFFSSFHLFIFSLIPSILLAALIFTCSILFYPDHCLFLSHTFHMFCTCFFSLDLLVQCSWLVVISLVWLGLSLTVLSLGLGNMLIIYLRHVIRWLILGIAVAAFFFNRMFSRLIAENKSSFCAQLLVWKGY